MSASRDARQGKTHEDCASAMRALGLASVALAFYFGFIALLVFRSHH